MTTNVSLRISGSIQKQPQNEIPVSSNKKAKPLHIMLREAGKGIAKAGVRGGGAAAAGVPAYRRALMKKFIIWFLVLLQICFIGCLWLLQLSGGLNPNLNDVPMTSVGGGAIDYISSDIAKDRVNFVKFKTSKASVLASSSQLNRKMRKKSLALAKKTKNVELRTVSIFQNDFFLKRNRNFGTEATKIPECNEGNNALWCFHEGTLNETLIRENTIKKNDDNDEDAVKEELEFQCKCLSNWHGKDCGQPEIIWRTLMTAKGHVKLQKPCQDKSPHNLIHMIEGNFFNLDLLELQIKVLDTVVDYFIIFNTNLNATRKEYNSLVRCLDENLILGNYLIYHCGNQFSSGQHNCTAAHAYRRFKAQLTQQQQQQKQQSMKPGDLFIYTDDRSIISRKALKFLKYYAATNAQFLMRFRLKYNIYGFYWQHPLQTYLTGVISSFQNLDNPQHANGDPMQLVYSAEKMSLDRRSNVIIIGDLNHFGGWFCKYCQQPDEIIAELHAQLSSSHTGDVQFPNASKSHNIDATYLQHLIANGIYVDGKTQLIKMHNNVEYGNRYAYGFAPTYAIENNSKFSNLLINLFESLDEDNENEE